MQNEQTLEQIIREYENMVPPEIMGLVDTFDWKREVRTIVNQNQLMIDTGADLEQSIYLMILGAVKVGDLYERLTDKHELPDDKARKIIQEVETAIFAPLHKKLLAMDTLNNVPPNNAVKDIVDRTSILGEIEKEPELVRPNMDTLNNIPPNNAVKDIVDRTSVLNQIEKEPVPARPAVKFDPFKVDQNFQPPVQVKVDQNLHPPVQGSGITKPFSLHDTEELAPLPNQAAQVIQNNPIAPTPTQPPVVKKRFGVDPYRESVE